MLSPSSSALSKKNIMIRVCYFDQVAGRVFSALTGPSLDGMPEAPPGQLATLTDYSGPLPAYWNGSVVQAIPAQPSASHVWSWQNKQWDYDLTEGRAQAWSRIKSVRESVEFGPFAWSGQTFDGDSESQRRIQGAAQLATMAQATGQPFSIDWTLADNTQVTLTAGEMIGVGVALGQHVNGAHGIARTLRTQIDAATTPEELEAIQWPA